MTGFDALLIVTFVIGLTTGLTWLWERISPDRDLQEPWHLDQPMCPKCGSRNGFHFHPNDR